MRFVVGAEVVEEAGDAVGHLLVTFDLASPASVLGAGDQFPFDAERSRSRGAY
ncbi:hypothetical protein [Streptomyces sp. NPDC102282]|uniref:hypothetical protein n=1 Tax=Streptomyces sp. NPDC102282 TaxID=3366154 RepID=UPI0037F3381E